MTRILSVLLAVILFSGCSASEGTSYQQISAEEAMKMMQEDSNAVVLDVREPDEYAQGHIPGAVLLSLGTIDADSAAAVIPEKGTTVLVYCRSGNRSKQASRALADLGYTQIYEFGGIRDWPYDITE